MGNSQPKVCSVSIRNVIDNTTYIDENHCKVLVENHSLLDIAGAY